MIPEKGKMFYNAIDNYNVMYYVFKIPILPKIWKIIFKANGDMKYILTPLTSQSRGIAIFLNNNFDYKVHNKLDDTSCNFLALDITFSNTRVCLVVIYGPNEDCPQFYKMVSEAISNLGNDNVIMVGDFNLVINPEKEYHNYLHINNKQERQCLKLSQHATYLMYIERSIQKSYTWRKPNPLKQARLDFFLISNSLLNMVQANDILASYK